MIWELEKRKQSFLNLIFIEFNSDYKFRSKLVRIKMNLLPVTFSWLVLLTLTYLDYCRIKTKHHHVNIALLYRLEYNMSVEQSNAP